MHKPTAIIPASNTCKGNLHRNAHKKAYTAVFPLRDRKRRSAAACRLIILPSCNTAYRRASEVPPPPCEFPQLRHSFRKRQDAEIRATAEAPAQARRLVFLRDPLHDIPRYVRQHWEPMCDDKEHEDHPVLKANIACMTGARLTS